MPCKAARPVPDQSHRSAPPPHGLRGPHRWLPAAEHVWLTAHPLPEPAQGSQMRGRRLHKTHLGNSSSTTVVSSMVDCLCRTSLRLRPLQACWEGQRTECQCLGFCMTIKAHLPLQLALAYVQPKKFMHRASAPMLSQPADCSPLVMQGRFPAWTPVLHTLILGQCSRPQLGSQHPNPQQHPASLPAIFSDWPAGHATCPSCSAAQERTA